FRQFADPVAVNVFLDAGGMVRTAPYALTVGGEALPSAAAMLAGTKGGAGTGFAIDFSIDPNTIPRVSAIDLLNGKVDPALISGRQAIIGASALELRDFFVIPRHGIIAGALLQVLAADTLKQGRALHPVPLDPTLWLAALAGGLVLLLAKRLPLAGIAAAVFGTSAGVEALALFLQVQDALLLNTAIIHVIGALVAVRTLVHQVMRRGELHRRAARERDETQRVLDRVIADNFDGVVVVNQDQRIIAASASAESMLGKKLLHALAPDVLPQELLAALQKPLEQTFGQLHTGEIILGEGQGGRVLEYVATPSEVGEGHDRKLAACLTFRDVTEKRRDEERLRYLGRHDPLTGALSRNRLVETINSALETDGGRAKGIGIVALDLRRFRFINDTLGHTLGDALLRQVVSRIKSMGPDAIARVGGDSFVMLVPETEPERLKGYASTVTRWLSFPYELDGHQAIIAASAGATTTEISGFDPETILSHADMALSAAKEAGDNAVIIFASAMDERLREAQRLDTALHVALERGEFAVAYQPQVDLATGRAIGAEALLRWNHPELGAISPGTFVPAAEETGLILDISRWMFETACREATTWPRDVTLSVNVSPVHFELSDVHADIATARRTGLSPERLTVEITEGVFVDQGNRSGAQLDSLRAMGVKVALDDFGTGYSSLGYLGRLPIDKIKIDQSFVKRLPADREAVAIVQAIMTLADTLEKDIVVEGVENADQAWMMKMLGCKVGQGYHFSRPRTPEEFAALLAPALRESA
ncbi:MAG: EAL domain-containing protein, partial [Devosia sp.]